MSDDGSFLARWSKRKREALERPAEETQAADGPTPSGAEGEEPFDLSALPDIESLTGESDLSAFLHKAVPEALRNAALRKVWALDPAVRDYVGEALDYAWDWNTPGGVPGFGEAVASEETMTFVRKLLAGSNEHENVNSDDAPQETEPDAASATAHARRTTTEADEDAAPSAKNADESEPLATPQALRGEHDPSPRPRRRHGGALPA